MRPPLLASLLAVAALVGCGDRPAGERSTERDSMALDALIGVPLLPGARIADIGGTGPTARVELSASAPVDTVATWYRRALLARGWTLASDVTTRDGAVTLHATGPGDRRLWLIIGPDSASAGTIVTVVGAVRDTAGR